MNAPSPSLNEPLAAADRNARIGLGFGLLAYALWGVLPIYFKALPGVPAIDIVAHRILWSLPFLAVLVVLTRGWSQIAEGLSDRRTLRLLLVTSALIAINWLLYVYAVTSGHILAGSLGYYLNPLMNIVLGRFILKERLTKVQWAAVAIAASGVSVLGWGAGTTLWISLTLCVTFATYGLLRKIVSVDAIAGLAIETAILFPLSLGWLLWGLAAGQPSFGSGETQMWLLVAAGVVSTTPLLLFTAAARRLRYSTLGILQFIAPTLQFIVAVWLYDEAFATAHAIAFGAIWIALALYVGSLIHSMRSASRAAELTCG
jgi:chloramphenicol-sensitive protein RarD